MSYARYTIFILAFALFLLPSMIFAQEWYDAGESGGQWYDPGSSGEWYDAGSSAGFYDAGVNTGSADWYNAGTNSGGDWYNAGTNTGSGDWYSASTGDWYDAGYATSPSWYDAGYQASSYNPSCNCYSPSYRSGSSITPIRWTSGTMAYPSGGAYSSGGGYSSGGYGGGYGGGYYGFQPLSVGSPRYAVPPTSYSTNSRSSVSNTSINTTTITNTDNSIHNSFNNYDSNNVVIGNYAPAVPVYEYVPPAPIRPMHAPSYVPTYAPNYAYRAAQVAAPYVSLSQIPYTGFDLPPYFMPLFAFFMAGSGVSMVGFAYPSRFRKITGPIKEFARDTVRLWMLY